MEKQKLAKKVVLAIAGILVAGGLLAGPSLLAGDRNTVKAETIEYPVYSVRAAEAQKQTLRAYLDVNGDIVSTQQTDVFPDVSGKLVSVFAGLGTYVQRGQVIAEVDPSRPGAVYMRSPVYAPISGIVSKMPLSVGMTVSQNTSITVISANGTLEITARIPEREVAGLAVGLPAEVSLQAYPGETFTATVNRVSPVLDTASRTKLINLVINQSDSRINAGMFSRVRINTRSYPDVLTVPAEAVVSNRGVDAVYVIRYGGTGQPIAERLEVSTGVTLQGWTEIKSGLAEGETVIIQGQQLLSGGEHLRIIGNMIALGDGAK
jgi:multidrug efflux pump subunit AcrA (membrane-fusion protein)